MTTDTAPPSPRPIAGSFRDPRARVYEDGTVIRRGLSQAGLADYEALAATPFFKLAVAEGQLIETARDDHPQVLAEGWEGALVHERVPVISYPYEWSYSMLLDAARLQLSLVADGLADGIACKDGTAYNIQFNGSRPVFIDIGSFEPTSGDAWPGYRQFCQLFLYPLLIEGHLGIPFAPLLRGSLDGIPPEVATCYFSGRDRLRPGVLTHVTLQAAGAKRYAERDDPAAKVVSADGTNVDIVTALAKRTIKLLDKLPVPSRATAWTDYHDRSHYEGSSLQVKDQFVGDVLVSASPSVVIDLGCNDGRYARMAARHATTVVAVDADRQVIDHLYESLRGESLNILPLVADLADPSPALGWGLSERVPLLERISPDVALSLALIHHLVIGRNIPINRYLEHLAETAPRIVLEVPHRDDPMVQRLLAAKPADTHSDYHEQGIGALIEERFTVNASLELPGGNRTIYDLVVP